MCMCFHVCDTIYLCALSGLTDCLWPRAVRPEPVTVCVLSRGQYLGTRRCVRGIFDSIMCCCVLWSCEAARWGDRGALCAAQHSSAQQRRPD